MDEKLQIVDVEALKTIIDQLKLEPEQQDRLKKRWLHYVRWWDQRARQSKWKYYTLRSIVIIGGATVPALLGLHKPQYTVLVTIISLLVAISAGLEGLFGFGEIWREKRAAAEILKVQGWRFFHLIKPYAGKTHREVFPDFADAVETMIEHEVKDYLVAAQGKSSSQPDKQPTSP